MNDLLIPVFLFCMFILTYMLELWTGFAFSGWANKNMLVHREKSPGPYWFIMCLQTIVLITAIVITAMSQR